MRSSALAVALLCAALGVALGFTPTRLRVWALLTLVCSALVSHSTLAGAIGPGWADGLFLACWVGVAGSAAAVYLREPVGIFAALTLALNTGILSGAITAAAQSQPETLAALCAVFVLWPVGWAADRHWAIPVKVVSSWLMTVAVLAAMLQFLPVTPGYLPDHVE